MLTHELTGIRNGKTQLLLNIAKGACISGMCVLFIVPTESQVKVYREIYKLTDVKLVSYSQLNIHRLLRKKKYDYILMDDTQAFDPSEGEPIKAIEALFIHQKDERPLILSARSELDT